MEEEFINYLVITKKRSYLEIFKTFPKFSIAILLKFNIIGILNKIFSFKSFFSNKINKNYKD